MRQKLKLSSDLEIYSLDFRLFRINCAESNKYTHGGNTKRGVNDRLTVFRTKNSPSIRYTTFWHSVYRCYCFVNNIHNTK